jgi:hypothetical protein
VRLLQGCAGHRCENLAQDKLRRMKRDNYRCRSQCSQSKGGNPEILKACDGNHHCPLCWASSSLLTGCKPSRNPKDRLRSHMRQRHPLVDSKLTLFTRPAKDAQGRNQYALCVCGAASCAYRGTVVTGDVWVRHPDAVAWQQSIIQ